MNMKKAMDIQPDGLDTFWQRNSYLIVISASCLVALVALVVSIYGTIQTKSFKNDEWARTIAIQQSLSKRDSMLSTKVDGMESRVNQLTSSVNRITTEQLRTDLSALEHQLGNLNKEVADLRGLISKNSPEAITLASIKIENDNLRSELLLHSAVVNDMRNWIIGSLVGIICGIAGAFAYVIKLVIGYLEKLTPHK
jgi:hypothetical protein